MTVFQSLVWICQQFLLSSLGQRLYFLEELILQGTRGMPCLSIISGDPIFAPATIAPVMISPTTESWVMIGFLVQGRVRIKIRIRVGVRVRVEVMVNISIYHRSNCHQSKCQTF